MSKESLIEEAIALNRMIVGSFNLLPQFVFPLRPFSVADLQRIRAYITGVPRGTR
jgi:hypothetical protein